MLAWAEFYSLLHKLLQFLLCINQLFMTWWLSQKKKATTQCSIIVIACFSNVQHLRCPQINELSLQVKKSAPGNNDLFVLLDFTSALHSPKKDMLLENKPSCILAIGSIGEWRRTVREVAILFCRLSLCSARVIGRTDISLSVKEEGINVKISVGG